MTLVEIAIVTALATGIAFIPNRIWRGWLILITSTITIYVLQPAVPLRNFGFWYPTMVMALILGTWLIVRPRESSISRQDRAALLVTVILMILIDLSRRFPQSLQIVAGGSPPLTTFIAAMLILMALAWFLSFWSWVRRAAPWLIAGIILAFFLTQKSLTIGLSFSKGMRLVSGQSVELASPLDLTWLGYSYIAFRLLHVIQDWKSGRLPSLEYRNFISYVLFFPALVAGPIDRVERFQGDIESTIRPSVQNLLEGGRRIILGCFKKFVLADALALLAMNEVNAPLVQSTGWAWILLYAYSFRLLLDFSGYTDIAIGLGNVMGFTLPENFQRPYLKADLTSFWNSWHITLAQWFRSYVFNPLTRGLRGVISREYTWFVILSGQMVTMTLIGLWHGFTWNFAIWGIWHGLGLFVHNRWVSYRRQTITNARSGRFASMQRVVGILMTFNFVSLGWVWFALPTLSMSLQTLHRLFGL